MSGCRSRSQAERFSIRCLIEFTFQVAMRMEASGLGRHHAEHHCELREQQPLDGRVHDAKAHEHVVDDALSAKHEAPSKRTNQAAGEERNGEQRDQQRRAPGAAQETDDCRGRNSEECRRRRCQCGQAGCLEKDGRSPALQERGIGCKRPNGLDPVGIRIEAP